MLRDADVPIVLLNFCFGLMGRSFLIFSCEDHLVSYLESVSPDPGGDKMVMGKGQTLVSIFVTYHDRILLDNIHGR